MAEVVESGAFEAPSKGSVGLNTQVAGAPTTVTGVAGVTGGIGAGNLIESDIDQELFKFKSDDTPLMQLMLMAKKVKVNSPVVDHYMIDEPRSYVTTTTFVTQSSQKQIILPLSANDSSIPRPYTTLIVKGVDGYAENGSDRTYGKDLMLFVVGHDTASGNPIVRAINGPKQTPSDEYCGFPNIEAGTKLIILANALYETQKEVDPDLIVPQPTQIYLQKRGMNQIVSDYYEAQRKKIPFGKALIAEAAITNFKVKCNRTLYAGRKGKMTVQTPKTGTQTIFFSEGVRYQCKRELQHVGKWTIEEIVALSKMIFTGEDVPKSVVCLAGRNFLENIQCIDYSKHPEIQITSKINPAGWTVTNFHTVFGDLELKHDPTLDRLGWANSAFAVAPDRLVHYQYSAEHSSRDRIDGEEATRESILVWDALALKGSCHIWIDGEGEARENDAFVFKFWGSEEAPTDARNGDIYYLTCDCPGIDAQAKVGQFWQVTKRTNDELQQVVEWKEYSAENILVAE